MPGRKRSYGAGAASARARARGNEGTKDQVEDLFQLVVAYAKQETVDPVVKQAKALLKGIAGAALMAFGTVLLALGFLRALQSEFGSTGPARSPVVAFVVSRGAPPPGSLFVGHNAVFASSPYGVGTHLSGDWSWVPYMGGSLFALVVAGVCVFRFLKGGPTR
jgi:hypothetical protein